MNQKVMRALACVTGLAATLSAVGAINSPGQATVPSGDRGAARLAAIAASDPTAQLDSDGYLYYTEPIPTGAHAAARAGAAAAARAPRFPLAQTFDLHSAPDSQRTIYLDFDGQSVSGTAWNDEGLPGGNHPAWSLDGNASTFNDHERTIVQEIWERVAEDFAPFDVDVTTADPGAAALLRSNGSDLEYGTRALITPSESALQQTCDGDCVGIAYMNVFDEIGGDHQPVWVFPQVYDDFIDDGGAKGIAETVSHEVGHNLNLKHDGNSDEGYDSGHNSWAPIMGNSDNEPISQWSKGDYTDADNQQDDFAVIANAGLDRRTDEAGDSIAAAAPEPPAGTAYITTRSDKDFYDLGQCSGAVKIDAQGVSVGTNLDIELRLYSTDGTQVAIANPQSAKVSAMVASGMSASISQSVADGSYVAAVDGIGRGTPTASYDDYASVGAYTLTVTGCDGVPTDPDPVLPGAPMVMSAASGAPGGRITGTVVWMAPADDGGSLVTAYRVKGTRWSATGRKLSSGTSSDLSTSPLSVVLTLPKAGIWSFRVQARNEVGYGPLSSPSKKIRGR